MKNKVLIKLIIPTLMEEYEIFIPVNERISKIKKIILKSLVEFTDSNFILKKNYNLLDPDTGNVYDNNMIIRDLNIKNSKRIIIF